jgi:hypothetical protein
MANIKYDCVDMRIYRVNAFYKNAIYNPTCCQHGYHKKRELRFNVTPFFCCQMVGRRGLEPRTKGL